LALQKVALARQLPVNVLPARPEATWLTWGSQDAAGHSTVLACSVSSLSASDISLLPPAATGPLSFHQTFYTTWPTHLSRGPVRFCGTPDRQVCPRVGCCSRGHQKCELTHETLQSTRLCGTRSPSADGPGHVTIGGSSSRVSNWRRPELTRIYQTLSQRFSGGPQRKKKKKKCRVSDFVP
jgi:hypothetical protein